MCVTPLSPSRAEAPEALNSPLSPPAVPSPLPPMMSPALPLSTPTPALRIQRLCTWRNRSSVRFGMKNAARRIMFCHRTCSLRDQYLLSLHRHGKGHEQLVDLFVSDQCGATGCSRSCSFISSHSCEARVFNRKIVQRKYSSGVLRSGVFLLDVLGKAVFFLFCSRAGSCEVLE